MFFFNLFYRNGKYVCCFGYKINKIFGNCDSMYYFIFNKVCFGVKVILFVFIRLMIMIVMVLKI